VYFTLRDAPLRQPQPREPIRFQLTLEHADSHGPVHIGCEGDVVRVEIGADAVGAAASVTAYDLGANEMPSIFP
jgi:hypothetical protein